MKSYLARLAARALPPPDKLPVAAGPVADLFANPEEADSLSATPTPPGAPPQISREQGLGHPPASAPKTFTGPNIAAAHAEFFPSSEHDDQAPLGTARPGEVKPSAENVAAKLAPDESSVVPRSPANLPAPPGETLANNLPPALVPGVPGPPPSGQRLAPNPDAMASEDGFEAKAEEPARLRPRDNDLLRLADRFMESIRTPTPEAAAPETLNPNDAPAPLPLHEPPWRESPLHQTEPDAPPAPSVHIGILRVEVVEPGASVAGRDRSSPPRTAAVRPRVPRHGAMARQRFGLRQL